jgi:hypothetical protein
MSTDLTNMTVTIPREEMEKALIVGYGFDLYVARNHRIMRSPDHTLFIVSDFCTDDDLIEVILAWRKSRGPQLRLTITHGRE